MQFHAVSCQLGTISASGSASHVASISIISGMDPASSAKILTSSLQKETQKQSRQYHTVSIFSPFHERTISSITDDRVKNRIDRGDTPLCERRFKIDCIAYSNGRICWISADKTKFQQENRNHFLVGHFHCWVSLVCRQHGQQQTLWFALENHNGGSGTRFRGKKGGTVQELQETSDFKGQDFVAWPRWRLNHLARVLPIMMQNVKLSATGVTMPENMSPWPIVGYSLPRVYPAAHHSKSQEVRNHSKIVKCEQKHSWINLCCNHESVGKTCDWKLRSLSYLKLMHNSEMYRNVRKLQHWQVYVPSQHSGPLPDSEFSTGPCEVNGIGVPALRARTRATKVEMEFCCASWLTCCAGVCIPYKGRKGAKVQTKEQVTWHSTWTKMPKMPMVLMRSEWFMMIYAVSLLRL